jgi:hypothetical protein
MINEPIYKTTLHKGVVTFFFGKPKKVQYIKSPFSYKIVKPSSKPKKKSQDKPINKEDKEDHNKDHKKEYNEIIVDCSTEEIFDKDYLKCIPRISNRGRDIALARYNKFKNVQLKGDNLIGLWQFKNNCWFNSLLMCLFFSDRTRELMNELRYKWISNISKDQAKSKLLYIFTHLMEIPHLTKDIISKIDSNMILTLLHKYDKSIFEHPGHEGGSGILYCRKVLSFLGFYDYMEIRLISLENQNRIYVEIDDFSIGEIDSNITYEELVKYILKILKSNTSQIRLLAIYIDIKPHFIIPNKLLDMHLECVYVSNYKTTTGSYKHAIAGITCSKVPYVYDGERAAMRNTLKNHDWRAYNTDTFTMTYDVNNSMKYNFSKSNRVAFYVVK